MNYYKKWKQFLNENILNEAAKDIYDLLDEDFYISIEKESDDDGYNVYLKNADDKTLGWISLFIEPTFSYLHSNAEGAKGWGPFLYDLAMQISTEYHNVPLVPTALVGGETSEEAKRVYKFYFNNRKSDVESEPFNNGSDKQLEDYLMHGYYWVGDNLLANLQDENRLEVLKK